MGVYSRAVKGKVSQEVRYLISDLNSSEVQRLGRSARRHWGIENGLHWVLDVSFREDAHRTRGKNGEENLGKVRRLALGLMRKGNGKQTIPTMMFKAALSDEFRTALIGQICNGNF
jgi:predicted transposase YbfD/YdcC